MWIHCWSTAVRGPSLPTGQLIELVLRNNNVMEGSMHVEISRYVFVLECLKLF